MFHNHFVFPTFFCIFAVMSLNRTFKITIFVTILMLCLTVNAKEEFTPTEQQQISVETPGLFSHYDAFQVDFAQLAKSEYSFPLPVGKAVLVDNNQALEITTQKGDAVKCMFDGVVRLSREIGLYGKVVVVRHDNGLETVYAQNAQNLAQKYPKLIVDNAHAYYDKPTGFACFNAGHKFGYKYSYLWLKNSPLQNIDIIKNDKILRKNEFLKLHEKYSSQNLLNIDTESIIAPFVYPLLIKSADEADKIVRFLNQEGKTIYRYWNQLPKNFNEYKFYSRLVPIPIIN